MVPRNQKCMSFGSCILLWFEKMQIRPAFWGQEFPELFEWLLPMKVSFFVCFPKWTPIFISQNVNFEIVLWQRERRNSTLMTTKDSSLNLRPICKHGCSSKNWKDEPIKDSSFYGGFPISRSKTDSCRNELPVKTTAEWDTIGKLYEPFDEIKVNGVKSCLASNDVLGDHRLFK